MRKKIYGNIISADDRKGNLEKKIEDIIETIIDDIENNRDYTRFKNYLKDLTVKLIYLNKKSNDLEEEILKIREEIFQNELSSEDLRNIMLLDYDED